MEGIQSTKGIFLFFVLLCFIEFFGDTYIIISSFWVLYRFFAGIYNKEEGGEATDGQ